MEVRDGATSEKHIDVATLLVVLNIKCKKDRKKYLRVNGSGTVV